MLELCKGRFDLPPSEQPVQEVSAQQQVPPVEQPPDVPEPQPEQTVDQPTPTGCDPSYPSLCLPVGAADIDCPEVGASDFTVLPPDPHGFDRDRDGIGCES